MKIMVCVSCKILTGAIIICNGYFFSDLVHFSTSSTGRVVTLDRLGKILWKLDLGSPMIAAYISSKDNLIAVPFTSVAEETFDHLLETFLVKPNDIQLLYVTFAFLLRANNS